MIRAGGVAAGVLLAAVAACSGKVTLVGFAKLDAELPVVDGWTREAPSGADIKLPAPASHVSAGYTKGTTFGGSPAVESWNSADHTCDLTVVLDKRSREKDTRRLFPPRITP